MADAQIDPRLLGDVILVVRTYPIRVGHIYDDKGVKIGDSGPFFPDSKELMWEQIGVTPEITTVTKRVRRVATFSQMQYDKALEELAPDYVHLSFCDYMNHDELQKLIETKMIKRPTHLGFGPSIIDVVRTTFVT
jgi:adenylosuccinate synthase